MLYSANEIYLGKKWVKNFVFQSYGVKNIKPVDGKRRNSNQYSTEMVFFPQIYINTYIYFHFIFENDSSFRSNYF